MSESPAQPETIAPPKPSGPYAALSSEQRSFMFWHAIVGAAIVNAILNALFRRGLALWALSEAEPAEP